MKWKERRLIQVKQLFSSCSKKVFLESLHIPCFACRVEAAECTTDLRTVY